MILADSLSAPEGPVVLRDRSLLVVEMGPEAGCVTHVSADGLSRRVVAKTGCPVGLAVDQYGAIWVAESRNPPSLLRVTMNGQVEVFLTECDHERFLFPNDLTIGPDGMLYMTDTGILYEDFLIDTEVRLDSGTTKFDGKVFAIDVREKMGTVLDTGLQIANGIAFGPEGDLYVNETITGMVYRYRQAYGRIVGDREPFGNVTDPDKPDVWRGPDGMAFDQNGLLYVAVYGQGDVTVLGRDGSVVRRIDTGGMKPTNVAFGADGEKKIYVTEDEKGVLLALGVDAGGLPLHDTLSY